MKKIRMLLVIGLLVLSGCSIYPPGTIFTPDGRCDPRYSPCGALSPAVATDVSSEVSEML